LNTIEHHPGGLLGHEDLTVPRRHACRKRDVGPEAGIEPDESSAMSGFGLSTACQHERGTELPVDGQKIGVLVALSD
jgi:hypothetical protein